MAVSCKDRPGSDEAMKGFIPGPSSGERNPGMAGSAGPGRGRSTARRVLGELGADRRKVVAAAILITISRLCLAFAPVVSGSVIDRISAGNALDRSFTLLCVLLGILVLIGYGMDAVVGTIMLRVAGSCVRRLREEAQRKMNRLPLRYLDMHPSGDIQSRLTADMVTLSGALQTSVSMISQIVLFVTVLVLMLLTDWRLSLAYFVIYPLGMLMGTAVVKRTRKLAKKRAKALGRLASKVTDTCDAHPVVKAYGCEKRMLEDFDKLLEEFDRANRGMQFMTGLIPVSLTAVNNISYIVCSILSGYLVLRGALTLGEFQAFLLFGNMLISPVLTISSGVNTMQQGMACAERIYEFLDEEEEKDGKGKACPESGTIKGSIEFDHVHFSYDEKNPLMRDVTFSVKPGATVAIVGPTGAGKTTLVNLLMRFYDIQGGSIRLDGTDVRSMDRRSLRRALGIVLQDSWIFDGTIRDNIAYGCPQAAPEQIRQTAQLVRCDTFIDKLGDGYDTHVSDESATLSSGERQLLSIARAALADRPILILDEATSQVDARTEFLITKAMERLMEGRTCFVIAHRLFTIRSADLILYMEAGDVAEIGTHEELMKRGGKYAVLYAAASDLQA